MTVNLVLDALARNHGETLSGEDPIYPNAMIGALDWEIRLVIKHRDVG